MAEVVQVRRPDNWRVCIGISNCSVVEWKERTGKSTVSRALQGSSRLGGVVGLCSQTFRYTGSVNA